MADPVVTVSCSKVSAGSATASTRVLPEETPIALVYDGSTHAVMMATPQDLQDFAYGFSLSEGQISDIGDIASFDVVEQDGGVELRMWMKPEAGQRLASRRRAMLGPTGCGLCGIESLEQALPTLAPVRSNLSVTALEIEAAVASLAPAQHLNRESRALHAAGFWNRETGLVMLREDVGRHNALDKLVGGLLQAAVPARNGVIVMTSRISIELVQKAAIVGAPILVAVSAPTALAVRTAHKAGITLVGIARDDSFEVFTHPERISTEPLRSGRSVHFKVEPHAVC